MKSKTKISLQTKNKRNPELVETINLAKNNKNWLEVANLLTYPRRKRISLNLDEINKIVKDGEKVVLPGKVLSSGRINKRIKISALNFSEGAMQKLKEDKIDFNIIQEEIKNNPSAEGIRVLNNLKVTR